MFLYDILWISSSNFILETSQNPQKSVVSGNQNTDISETKESPKISISGSESTIPICQPRVHHFTQALAQPVWEILHIKLTRNLLFYRKMQVHYAWKLNNEILHWNCTKIDNCEWYNLNSVSYPNVVRANWLNKMGSDCGKNTSCKNGTTFHLLSHFRRFKWHSTPLGIADHAGITFFHDY